MDDRYEDLRAAVSYFDSGELNGRDWIVLANHDTFRALMAERDFLSLECAEQARINGIGSEREARLISERDFLLAERDRLREALEESQSLFAAMLHEQRPRCEIEDQMIDNRAALSQERP